MENESQSSQVIGVLRWVVFLPCAFIGAWLAWYLWTLLNRISFGLAGVDLNSFMSKAFLVFTSNVILGAAFVYIGAKVAPVRKKIVAYVLAVICLVLVGFTLYPAIMTVNYWAIFGGIAIILGCTVTAYAASIDDLDL